MADRLDQWECNILAHARAYRRARHAKDGESMSRHVLGIMAVLRDPSPPPDMVSPEPNVVGGN